MKDWRKSAKADELREFIDKSFRVRKPNLGNLERELVIDFVAKEIEAPTNLDTVLKAPL